MKIRTFLYSIKQGFKNIYRNRLFSLASVGTITACLFLFGIFYFILSNFQYMIETAETSVGVTVFFEEGLDMKAKREIGEQIQARPEVDRIHYLSAEETWENYKKNYLKPELAATFGDDNPLQDSDSYEVYLNDVTKQRALVMYIHTLDGVRQVNSSDATASGLASFSNLVGYISAAIMIILLAVSIFLISTTVAMGISVRSEEISIMRLIGATDYFIRAPFIVEGILIGIMGAILPMGILYVIYDKVVTTIMSKFNTLANILSFLDIQTVFQVLLPLSLAIGVGIGFIGSRMTVRKHLREIG